MSFLAQSSAPILFFLLALPTLLSAAPPSPAPVRKLSYDNYRFVRTRNIFDPERKPGVVVVAPSQIPAPTQADYVALTGILLTSEKSLAFFSGSRPEYNKVLAVSGTLCGATVVKITEANIEVTRGKMRFTIAVGQTLPLTANAVPGPAPGVAPVLATGSAASMPSTSDPDKDALLRRMMERRQRELK